MQLTPKIKQALGVMRGHFTKRNVIIAGAILLVSGLVFAYWPRTVEFSYAGDNCFNQLSVFPQVLKSSEDSQYRLEIGRVVGLGVLGLEACARPIGPPQEGEARLALAPFGLSFLAKTYIIKTPAAPVVSVQLLEEPIPAKKPVILPLSESDEIFNYHLASRKRRVVCDPKNQAVSCDISKLELAQGQTHEISVERTFEGREREVITTKGVQVLPAVVVDEASVAEGQVVYDKPQSFEFQFDKELESAKVELARIEGEALHNTSASF